MRIRSYISILIGLAICLFNFLVFADSAHALPAPPQNTHKSDLYSMLYNQSVRQAGSPGSVTSEAFESFRQLQDVQDPMSQYPDGGPIHQGSQASLHQLTMPQNVQDQRKQTEEPGQSQAGYPNEASEFYNATCGKDCNTRMPQPWRLHNEGGIEQTTKQMPNKLMENAFNAWASNEQSTPLPVGSIDSFLNTMTAGAVSQISGSNPQSGFNKGKSDVAGLSQGASNTLADAFDPTWLQMLRLQNEGLLNVANEATGSPTSSLAVTKTHRNAVWFVQRMYQEVYIPMAILLILPGAVLTQMKGLVSFGVLSSTNDEDAVSPFSGILRGMIALFLIPATQLICSYTIDVGNSLHHEVKQHVDAGLIFRWADEQVFKPGTVQNAVLDPMMFPVLGKMSQGLEAASGMEEQSAATSMLQTLANGTADSAAFGLVMLSAFQIIMICYLLCMGPIAAAFYAWPSGMGSLFNRIFSAWLDSIINIALWKFWWTIVLLCITVRLNWIGNPAGWVDEWELLMFIAFMVILTYVPFNPFDYKAGEMVSKVMQLADSAVNDASKG